MDATLNVSDREQSAKRLTTIIYARYAGGLLTGGLTALVAIIMNYVKKAEVAGTWLESHFQSQKKTFWYSFIGIFGGSVLASIAGMVGAAIAVWMGNFLGVIIVFIAGCIWLVPAGIFIWSIYRTVVGWLALSNNKPA